MEKCYIYIYIYILYIYIYIYIPFLTNSAAQYNIQPSSCHRKNKILIWYRRSHPEVFRKKSVLKNFAKFSGKHLCQSLFFNEVAGLRPAILLKNRLWHRCFPVNFAKFLKTPFFMETSGGLLLVICRNEFRTLSNIYEGVVWWK